MKKQNDKYTGLIKYSNGFINLTEKVKINDRGYLIFLVIAIGLGILLGICQPGPAHALNFNAGSPASGSIGGYDSDFIKALRFEAQGDSGAGGQIDFIDPRTGEGQGGPGAVNQKADGLNQFQIIEEREAMPEVKSLYQKKNVGQDQNQIIAYASEVSGNNLDFISTLEAENGLWSIDRVSKANRNGTKDFGLCQLNSQYHRNFIKSEEFKDYKKQISYCYGVYSKRPTAFYGYYKRGKMKSKFYLST